MKRPDDIGRMAQHFEDMHKRHHGLRHRFLVAFVAMQIAAVAATLAVLATLAIAFVRWLA